MTTKTSCTNIGALVDYVRAKSPENLHLLWAPLKVVLADGEDPERFVANPKNSVTIDICQKVMEQTRKATLDEMAVYKAALGHGCKEQSSPGFFRSIFGLKYAVRKAQKLQGRFPAGKKIEIVSVSDTHSVVRLHWPKDLHLNRDFCLFAKGIYQAIPTMFHFSLARLWERTCFFDGALCCEYELWWDKRVSHSALGLNSALNRESLRLQEDRMVTDKKQTKVSLPAHKKVVTTNRPKKEQAVVRSHLEPPKKPPKQKNLRADTIARPDTGTTFKAKDLRVREIEPVGIPSNGIAKELNDIFSGIQECLSLMRKDIDSGHPHFRHLKAMDGMTKMGTTIAKGLLGLKKDGKDRVKSADPNNKKLPGEKGLFVEVPRGTETVLIVDDEGVVLDVTQQMLKAIGYKVIIARTGTEAIELYKRNKENIDMVILDMIVPDMGGGKAYDRLKEIDPDLKVLLSSGYSVEGEARHTLARGCNGFIQKPFSIGQLSEKMRAILDGPVYPTA